jgi:hypothetical protein
VISWFQTLLSNSTCTATTWFAFEVAFTVGSARGGGEEGLKLPAPSGAPGGTPGIRAPGMGAAVVGLCTLNAFDP